MSWLIGFSPLWIPSLEEIQQALNCIRTAPDTPRKTLQIKGGSGQARIGEWTIWFNEQGTFIQSETSNIPEIVQAAIVIVAACRIIFLYNDAQYGNAVLGCLLQPSSETQTPASIL